eukprot:GHRR01005652.1.p1 GENE.GHRR01005652.1~~GHRR01005652.1.p1  ORF type:complete len:183 (+),score=22.21 GHRR01005652.1:192-740(+)
MDPQLKAWFDAIDTDRSGRLDAKELQRALALGNLNFGLNDVDQMVRAFDTSNARSLGYEEFQRLHIFLVNVQNSFQTFDRDRSGKLTPDEVTNALRQAGFNLDPPAMMAMVSFSKTVLSATAVFAVHLLVSIILYMVYRKQLFAVPLCISSQYSSFKLTFWHGCFKVASASPLLLTLGSTSI